MFSEAYESKGPHHELVHCCHISVISVDLGLHHVCTSRFCKNGACFCHLRLRLQETLHLLPKTIKKSPDLVRRFVFFASTGNAGPFFNFLHFFLSPIINSLMRFEHS